MGSSANLTPFIECKYDKDMIGLLSVNPFLFFIFADVSLWCYKRNLPVVVTSTVRDKIKGVSVSTTHEESRAIDMSVRGYDLNDIDELVLYVNTKFAEEYGAFSYSDGKPRVAVYHSGTDWHIHFQCRRNL